MDEYVVDTWGLPRGAEIDACRLALTSVAKRAHTFETDIPWSRTADWPADVQHAAHLLSSHSTGRRRESDAYQMTGVLSAKDLSDWEAFVTFAPYAFDASVWGADLRLLASLSDEGTGLTIHLQTDEHDALVSLLGAVRVIPWFQWKRMRRRRREDRS